MYVHILAVTAFSRPQTFHLFSRNDQKVYNSFIHLFDKIKALKIKSAFSIFDLT